MQRPGKVSISLPAAGSLKKNMSTHLLSGAQPRTVALLVRGIALANWGNHHPRDFSSPGGQKHVDCNSRLGCARYSVHTTQAKGSPCAAMGPSNPGSIALRMEISQELGQLGDPPSDRPAPDAGIRQNQLLTFWQAPSRDASSSRLHFGPCQSLRGVARHNWASKGLKVLGSWDSKLPRGSHQSIFCLLVDSCIGALPFLVSSLPHTFPSQNGSSSSTQPFTGPAQTCPKRTQRSNKSTRALFPNPKCYGK